MEITALNTADHPKAILIGKPVEFWFRGVWYIVSEYFDVTAKLKYTWTGIEKETKKVIWNGPCRSTRECIRFVIEHVERNAKQLQLENAQ